MTAMAAQMTASDFALWRAFYAQLPDRTEFYLSQICHLIAAAAGIKRKDGTPFTSPADFEPDFRTFEERIEMERRRAESRAAFDKTLSEARAKANGGAG